MFYLTACLTARIIINEASGAHSRNDDPFAMLSLLRCVNEYEIHFCMTPENDKAFLILPWNKKDDPELLMVLMCNLV